MSSLNKCNPIHYCAGSGRRLSAVLLITGRDHKPLLPSKCIAERIVSCAPYLVSYRIVGWAYRFSPSNTNEVDMRLKTVRMKYIWSSYEFRMIWTSYELHKNYMTSTQEVPLYYTRIWFLASLLCTSFEWASRSIIVIRRISGFFNYKSINSLLSMLKFMASFHSVIFPLINFSENYSYDYQLTHYALEAYKTFLASCNLMPIWQTSQ